MNEPKLTTTDSAFQKSAEINAQFEKAGNDAVAIIHAERIAELRRAVKQGLPHEIYDAIVDLGRETIETYEKCDDDDFVMELALQILAEEENEHV